MRNVKAANAGLWIANTVLIVGIAAFAFEYLLQERKPLLDPDTRPMSEPVQSKSPNTRDVTMLRDMPNPLQAPKKAAGGGSGSLGAAKLLGTDSISGAPQSAVAYLIIVTRNVNVNAYVGEAVHDSVLEQDVAELSGWTLKSVTHNTATFVNAGREETLKIDDTIGAVGSGNPLSGPNGGATANTAWDKAKYASKKLDNRSTDTMEVWEIDRKEADWAGTNWEQSLSNVQLSLYPGGGVKIDALPDGIAADRGFKSNDVIRVINGQAIDNVAKLSEIMKGLNPNNPALTIQVDRGGRNYTIQYQLSRVKN